MRFVAYVKYENDEQYKKELKDMKKQMKQFLNDGEKVIYIKSENTSLSQIYEIEKSSNTLFG